MLIGRFKLLQIADRTSTIYPVRRCDLSLFEELRLLIRQAWLECSFDTQRLIATRTDVCRAIALLIPSDPRLPLDVDLLLAHPKIFESLVIAQWDELGNLGNAIAVELNTYDSLNKRRERGEDDPITLQDIPFPSSGNADCDTLASLIAGFEIDAALRIWTEFNAEAIDQIMHTLAELRRNPDDRIREHLENAFWKSRDTEEYRKSLLEDW